MTITFSSPDSGRQPSSASAVAAAISAATWLFMSSAPRPQTQPSLSSPDHGSTLQSAGIGQHGVDVAEQHEARPVGAAPPAAAIRFGPALDVGQQLGLEARVLEQVGEERCASSSLPGGLTVLKRMSFWSSSVARRSRSAGSGKVPRMLGASVA